MSTEHRDPSQEASGAHTNRELKSIAIFLDSVTEALPAEFGEQITETSLRVLIEQFHGVISTPESWPVFYNQVANELSRVSTQVSAELYARAYDTERPYKAGTYRPLFASNFIKNYAQFINTVQNLTSEQKEWIADRKTTLEDALECIIHFWHGEINKEGKRQAPKKADDVRELAGVWNPDALAKVTGYQEVYKIAKELQEGPLKFV